MDKKIEQLHNLKIFVEVEETEEEIEQPVLDYLNISIRKMAENEMKMIKEMMQLSEQINETSDSPHDNELWIENSFVFNV
jgi:hypothetical protein